MIDRGFIKWQAFEALTPSKETLRKIEEKEKCPKPKLFPEEINQINDALREAYYSTDVIEITYYEAGKIKKITSTIKKINPSTKTMELGCGKRLYAGQILHISS